MGKAADRARPGDDAAGGSSTGPADAAMAARAEAEAEAEANVEASGPPTGDALNRSTAARPVDDSLMEDLREVRVAASTAIGGGPDAPPDRPGPSASVLAASLFLVGCAILSVSFMLTRGGLAVPTGAPGSSPVAIASSTPAPTAAPSPTTSPTAPTAGPSPTTRPTAAPTPTSSLLALLEPCPDKPDCYLYTVRTDDSLGRISRRFGIPVDTILALNPWITDPSIIHPGEVITLPPPTR